jgi:hypothetical protein
VKRREFITGRGGVAAGGVGTTGARTAHRRARAVRRKRSWRDDCRLCVHASACGPVVCLVALMDYFPDFDEIARGAASYVDLPARRQG